MLLCMLCVRLQHVNACRWCVKAMRSACTAFAGREAGRWQAGGRTRLDALAASICCSAGWRMPFSGFWAARRTLAISIRPNRRTACQQARERCGVSGVDRAGLGQGSGGGGAGRQEGVERQRHLRMAAERTAGRG